MFHGMSSGVTGPVHVQGCEKQGKSRRCECESGFSSWLCPEPATLHHCVRGSTLGVANRISTGAAVHRRPDDQCWVYCTYQYFPPEGGGRDTGGIRQQNNANGRELDRTPRQGGGKLDTLSGSSELDYITNLMIRPRNFEHHIFTNGLGIRPQFFKTV